MSLPNVLKTDVKRNVVLQICCGVSIKTAAQECGVSYETVLKWYKGDAVFKALLAEARAGLMENAANTIGGLLETAVGLVKEQIEGGDVKLAMALLTKTGALEHMGAILGAKTAKDGGGSGVTINVKLDDLPADCRPKTVEAEVSD